MPPARRRHFGQKVRRPRRHQRYKKDREKEKKKERKKENGLTDIDGAVDVVDESKEKVVSAQYAIFVVGAGGFGGKRVSEHLVPTVETPKRAPDASLQFQTSIDQVSPPPPFRLPFYFEESPSPAFVCSFQAALYRLCGDLNPLHIDPSFAAMGGFDQPILHGLCSYGVACRQVLRQFAGNDVTQFQSMKVHTRNSYWILPGFTALALLFYVFLPVITSFYYVFTEFPCFLLDVTGLYSGGLVFFMGFT